MQTGAKSVLDSDEQRFLGLQYPSAMITPLRRGSYPPGHPVPARTPVDAALFPCLTWVLTQPPATVAPPPAPPPNPRKPKRRAPRLTDRMLEVLAASPE